MTLAHLGNRVVAVDTDEARVTMLRNGRVPFFEPGLQEMLSEEVAARRVRFATDFAEVLADAVVAFLCMGTPPRATGDVNLRALETSARPVARHVRGRVIVVEKSTVPAGTAIGLRSLLKKEGQQAQFEVVSNPEFLREGSAVNDDLHPPRILIGAEPEYAFEVMRRLYGSLVAAGASLIETDIVTAELAKHATNAFLALKISFINGVARVCERLGAEVRDVADLMGSDPRIGRAFLDAGLGFGGSCFHKDLLAFHSLAMRAGYEFPLLLEVLRLNDEAVDSVLSTIEEALWSVSGKTVALLGLAFKPETDDIRFSPALRLAERLLDAGADVVGHDPRATENARAALGGLRTNDDVYTACEGAHCLVLCTEWEEFRSLELGRLAGIVADPILVDGRNFLNAAELRRAGFSYYPVGAKREADS